MFTTFAVLVSKAFDCDTREYCLVRLGKEVLAFCSSKLNKFQGQPIYNFVILRFRSANDSFRELRCYVQTEMMHKRELSISAHRNGLGIIK